MTASIVVFGSESTGKTTLTHALARRLGCAWSSEYVRDFWHANDGDIRASDLTRIAAGQIERMATARASAAQRAARYVLHDTDLLTHVLWVDLLFPGQCADWVMPNASGGYWRFNLSDENWAALTANFDALGPRDCLKIHKFLKNSYSENFFGFLQKLLIFLRTSIFFFLQNFARF